MGTKLYVANLPDAPSAHALRAHFGACGPVSDVQLVLDRYSGRGRGTAFVWMSNTASAKRAISELNGAPFAGQLLVVEESSNDLDERPTRANRRAEENDALGTRITLQFREQANMTYELICAGVVVVVRVFFPSDTGQVRVVAQASHDSGAPSSAAVAPSRIEAFRDVARACREGVDLAALARVDWDAVEAAMLTVRAL